MPPNHHNAAPNYHDHITGIPPEPSTLRKLGHIVGDRLGLQSDAEVAPIPDELLTVSGKRPRLEAVHKDAYAEPRPLKESLSAEDPEAIEAARRYVDRIFPKITPKLLSKDGSSCYVFEDSEGKYAFKVDRHYGQAEHAYAEREVALMQRLHARNLAPKPYLLVDPKKEAQFDGRDFRTSTEDKIPRVEEEGNLAIIVMDKVNFTGVEHMSPDLLLSEFDRALAISEELGIVFSDTEFEYDTDNNRLTAIDVGAVDDEPSAFREMYPDIPADKYEHVMQVAGLFEQLVQNHRSGMTKADIAALLEAGGIAAIHEKLLHVLHGNPTKPTAA
jgi:hypothetical protein